MVILGAVYANPTPEKEVKKAYYTSPIKEIKGTTFFQWRKFDAKPVVAVPVSKDEMVAAPVANEKEKSTSASVKKD